jgi:uncharacterized protein involved in exopolysaccharide biosynthesis
MVAFFLPNTYQSRAVLRITPSQIPENLVPATFNQQMSDRILAMWQEITSRSSLSELIQRPALELYKSDRASLPLDDVIEKMRSKDLKTPQFQGMQQSGKPSSAFVVVFEYSDRFKAQQVVNALVTKFTDANHAVQKGGVDSTLQLIQDEVTQAKADVDRVDSELTSFKTANSGRLPEQLSINVNAMTSLQTSLNGVNEALSRNQGDKMMQETNLANLQAQYTQLETALSAGGEDSSPAVAAAKNEELIQLNHDIATAEARLTVMRQNYTEQYPDVIDLKNNIAALKKHRDQLVKDDAAALAEASAKAKPAPRRSTMPLQAQQQLAQLKQRIDNVKDALKILDMEKEQRLKQQEKYQRDLQVYQDRISASPANEQRYASLMRERQIAGTRYEELQHKYQLASQGEKVQERKAGENLEVLDPASLPETPTAPNRWQIVGMGAMAGLLLGVSLAATREMRDTSLKNLKDVRAYTNLPVLSSIPLLENAMLVRRKRSLVYVGWSIAVIVGLIGTAASLYYHFAIAGK